MSIEIKYPPPPSWKLVDGLREEIIEFRKEIYRYERLLKIFSGNYAKIQQELIDVCLEKNHE